MVQKVEFGNDPAVLLEKKSTENFSLLLSTLLFSFFIGSFKQLFDLANFFSFKVVCISFLS